MRDGLLGWPAAFFNNHFAYTSRLNMGFSRGALNLAARRLDPTQPATWEFSAFSQNGEDGIMLDECLHRDPDFFSLDIDSNDYFVMVALLEQGLRPKVVCVEYNSAFGPTATLSIRYTASLDYLGFHESQLYYGVSVAGWRTLFERHGYIKDMPFVATCPP